MDDSGFPVDTRQTTGLSGFRVQKSEVFGTMIGARELYNLGGSATIDFVMHLNIHYI
jgi:hypothetical protein